MMKVWVGSHPRCCNHSHSLFWSPFYNNWWGLFSCFAVCICLFVFVFLFYRCAITDKPTGCLWGEEYILSSSLIFCWCLPEGEIKIQERGSLSGGNLVDPRIAGDSGRPQQFSASLNCLSCMLILGQALANLWTGSETKPVFFRSSSSRTLCCCICIVIGQYWIHTFAFM